MKYKIEFELPDNDTVLREIKKDYVHWSIWGYSGSCKARPVQRKGKWIKQNPMVDTEECSECGEYMCLDIPFTNADRIRDMTNDQLVRLFTAFEYDGRPIFTCPADNPNCSMEHECRECFLNWLKQEVKQ